MSIATLSPKLQASIPADELVGSMTKERVDLLVRQAGIQSLENSDQAARWLAYAANADVPAGLFTQLNMAFSEREDLNGCDLEYWFDIKNTQSNRDRLIREAEETITAAVYPLVVRLCSQLGIRA